jgi:hypothetical protein
MIFYFPKAHWAESRSRPSRPPLAHGPRMTQHTVERPGQPSGRAPVLRSPIQPVKRESDPISLEPVKVIRLNQFYFVFDFF